ncbi:MAG: type II toxin-antitoxin system VapC family toxin [Acidobacteriia bacterium]|nr:type II toxin-antitoxin system VapC family toxin [Terriglobia bacterium]
MSAYLETSFLVSLYTSDANSTAAALAMRRATGPFPIGPFGELELANAIELRRFRREINAEQARAALADVASDLAHGVFYAVAIPAAIYDHARMLARKHAAVSGTRTLDILHVAAALTLAAESFYTFDRRQAQLARAEGLATPVRIP